MEHQRVIRGEGDLRICFQGLGFRVLGFRVSGLRFKLAFCRGKIYAKKG